MFVVIGSGSPPTGKGQVCLASGAGWLQGRGCLTYASTGWCWGRKGDRVGTVKRWSKKRDRPNTELCRSVITHTFFSYTTYCMNKVQAIICIK